MEQKQHRNALIFALLVLVLTAGLFFLSNDKLNQTAAAEKERQEQLARALEAVPVSAKAVSIYNATELRKIYGKNDEAAMPIASLVKTMTVVTALNGAHRTKVISVSPMAIRQAGDFGIRVNEKWQMDDLAKFTMIASANDGAYALSESDSDFLTKMHHKARRLGLVSASFLNTTGLDSFNSKGKPLGVGGYISAADANTLALYALKAYPDIFQVTAQKEINLQSVSGFKHNFKNTNMAIDQIPNLLFSKTGFTALAGGNLTVVFRDNQGDIIAITVLGSTFEGRFHDMEKLVAVLYNN